MSKCAVVLFNLGGPDGPEAIQPFLFNLFNDPAIIGLPFFLRQPLAHFISSRRAPVAAEIYAHLGGRSPLLELTQGQASALHENLGGGDDVRVFIAMRYWHPLAGETAKQVREFDPDEIILMPLYPHYSSTTTGSSLTDWHKAAKDAGLDKPASAICCYPLMEGLIRAHDKLLQSTLSALAPGQAKRVLFSAHGLPEKIILAGDPYQFQIEQTARALASKAGLGPEEWVICYQSRVGRLKWIGPSIDEALRGAAEDGRAVLVVPISFVSDHSETLVELDIEYAGKAKAMGIDHFARVPALGCDEDFIGGLAGLARRARHDMKMMDSGAGGRSCPEGRQCPCSTSDGAQHV
ncbi:MAG: ferrochelatase [Rhodospirillales bacterium]|jgi:ferrochelatase|nr:ferrochelatase [Rhodospirillales bacterium]